MMRSVARAGVLAVVLCLPAGCLSFLDDPIIGPPSGLMRIALRDKESGERIEGASIVASDGSYRTYLLEVAIPAGIYMGVYREGVYRLEITAAGYQPLEVEDVVVEEVNGQIETAQELFTMTPE